MKKRNIKILTTVVAVCMLITQVFCTNLAFAADSSALRLYGADRYKTAVAISKSGWSYSTYAVIARGDDFPDALCAGPLAKVYNAPILLTETSYLNQDTLAELKRLGVTSVIIAGGPGAVSDNVITSLKANGISNVERIYGSDRYETSAKIAERIAARTGSVTDIVLATGNDYPDALSIAPIASQLNMPILLTDKSTLPLSVKNFLINRSSTIDAACLLGGSLVISTTVEYAVKGYISEVSRLYGSDRFATNVEVLKYFKDELNYDRVYVAVGEGPTGKEFADALTGAVLAAKNAAPLILTGSTLPYGTKNYLSTVVPDDSAIVALGGTSAVPNAVIDAIAGNAGAAGVDKTYSKSGTYGKTSGTETITGDLTITASGVVVKNTVVKGDLKITDKVGNGTVTLDNVKVEGETTVEGGGASGIKLIDFTCDKLTADGSNSNLRISAQGESAIDLTVIDSDVIIEEENMSDEGGFKDLDIKDDVLVELTGDFEVVDILGDDSEVTLEDGNIDELNVSSGSTGCTIEINENGHVAEMEFNGPADVSGDGDIDIVSINSKSVEISQDPGLIYVKSGVTAKIDGSTVSSGTSGDYEDEVFPVYAVPSTETIPSGTKVTLKTATSGAKIYYTTNGSTPSSSSTKYSTPITVSKKTTIKAIAVKSGLDDSTVTSFTYTVTTSSGDDDEYGDDVFAYATLGEVDPGDRIKVEINVDGDIYMVPEGTNESESSFKSKVNSDDGVTEYAEEGDTVYLDTDELDDDVYVLYVVDDDGDIHGPSNEIYLGVEADDEEYGDDVFDYATVGEVDPGDEIEVVINVDGDIYLVPEGTNESESSFKTKVNSGNGVKEYAEVGDVVYLETDDLDDDVYVLYVVDDDNDIHGPSKGIYLGVEDESSEYGDEVFEYATVGNVDAGDRIRVEINVDGDIYMVPEGSTRSETNFKSKVRNGDGVTEYAEVDDIVYLDTDELDDDVYVLYVVDDDGDIHGPSDEIYLGVDSDDDEYGDYVFSYATVGEVDAGTRIKVRINVDGTIYMVKEGTSKSFSKLENEVAWGRGEKVDADEDETVYIETDDLTDGTYVLYVVNYYGTVSGPSDEIYLGEESTEQPEVTFTETNRYVYAKSDSDGWLYLVLDEFSNPDEEDLDDAVPDDGIRIQCYADSTVTFDKNQLDDGTYVLYAVDKDGNVSEPSGEIEVD